eukprot:SAG31_NODE_6158_length_2144_cov_1.501222_2_plen_103_part_00
MGYIHADGERFDSKTESNLLASLYKRVGVIEESVAEVTEGQSREDMDTCNAALLERAAEKLAVWKVDLDEEIKVDEERKRVEAEKEEKERKKREKAAKKKKK